MKTLRRTQSGSDEQDAPPVTRATLEERVRTHLYGGRR